MTTQNLNKERRREFISLVEESHGRESPDKFLNVLKRVSSSHGPSGEYKVCVLIRIKGAEFESFWDWARGEEETGDKISPNVNLIITIQTNSRRLRQTELYFFRPSSSLV